MTEIDSDTIKMMIDNARAQGEQQGKAVALAEQEAARVAAEQAERQRAQDIIDAYNTVKARNPFQGAAWMAANGRNYEAACRALRGGK